MNTVANQISEPVTRASAYEDFRTRLFSGQLKPGQFVTQKELATLAGVSVGTAREAIQKLEHDGLLRVHPQRGIQVADITIRFIREAFHLRKMIETEAIDSYVNEGGNKARRILIDTRDILERARSDTSQATLDMAVDIDWRFHDELISTLNNRLLIEIYQINAVRLRLIRANIQFKAERALGALSEHIAILEACAAGRADIARDALSAHLSVAMTRAIEGL